MKLVQDRQGITVSPDFIFDTQAKRLHEYKRQMLNALHILVLYNRLVSDPTFEMEPRVFFFGAKASPDTTVPSRSFASLTPCPT